jgi:hypothetical protein
MGGQAGIIAALERMGPMACAVFYETPALAMQVKGTDHARTVLHFGPNRFMSTGGVDINGVHYSDSLAGDFGGAPLWQSLDSMVIDTLGTVQHETDHQFSAPDNMRPKWIEETFADFGRLMAGYTAETDRPTWQAKHWCNGYKAGAYFFQWIEAQSQTKGFVHKLFKWILGQETAGWPQGWPGGYPQDETNSDQVFHAVTGSGLSDLYNAYIQSLGIARPPIDCDASMWTHY